MAIFFSRPLTLTINSLDIYFLSVCIAPAKRNDGGALDTGIAKLKAGLAQRRNPKRDRRRNKIATRPAHSRLCVVVVGNRRRDSPAVDFAPPVSNRGDAFEIDQTDRDLSRFWCLPSAGADGHKLNSNRNSVDRSPPFTVAPGSGASVVLRRALKPGSRT